MKDRRINSETVSVLPLFPIHHILSSSMIVRFHAATLGPYHPVFLHVLLSLKSSDPIGLQQFQVIGLDSVTWNLVKSLFLRRCCVSNHKDVVGYQPLVSELVDAHVRDSIGLADSFYFDFLSSSIWIGEIVVVSKPSPGHISHSDFL